MFGAKENKTFTNEQNKTLQNYIQQHRNNIIYIYIYIYNDGYLKLLSAPLNLKIV